MLYTEEYVREKYTKYNNELFGGQLPPFDELEFHITMKKNPHYTRTKFPIKKEDLR